MDVSHSTEYNKDVDTCFRKITDKEFVTQKLEALGARNVTFQEYRTDGANCFLKYTREEKTDAPAAIKKFVKEWSQVESTDDWKGSEGGERNCDLTVHMAGVPVKITGDIKLSPTATGTSMAITLHVHCGIPLVGKKLEQFVGNLAKEGVVQEFEYMTGIINA